MPASQAILGFTNRWYHGAIVHAVARQIDGKAVLIATAPYFLAMKLDAFDGRGEGDYVLSHDLEDFIAVVDSRHSIVEETSNAPLDVRAYLCERVTTLLANDAFREALPGHLPGDPASQARVPIVLARLRGIAGASASARG